MATIIPIIGKNAEKIEQTEIPIIGKNVQKSEFTEQTVIPTPSTSTATTSSNTTTQWNIFKDFDPAFSCIEKALVDKNINLMKSLPTESPKYIYEYTTDLVDGVATKVLYFIDGIVEFRKREGEQVIKSGNWKCTSSSSYRLCWDGQCDAVDVGGTTRVIPGNCCSGGGNTGTSGSSGSSGTSGGGSAPFSCPSGYVTTSLGIDVVWDCDNKKSFKPCMKGRVIKELQEIPALAFYIESIQKRDNKSVKFDEYYGPIMKEAVEMLQSEPSRSLTTDGIIGCATLNSLLDNPDAPDTSDVDDNSNIQDNLDNSNSDIKKDEDNKTDVKKIKPSFQVDRSFFNPNDEW